MESYSVIGADGQTYGPADETALAQWAREGRINAHTQLHSHETGQRVWAYSVPSLGPVLGLSPEAVNALLHSHAAGYSPATAAGLQYAGPATGIAGHGLTQFSVAATVLLTFCTFGIFPWIHFGLMHDKMPRTRPDDPTSVKAILFHLIPVFSLYWMFFERLRLMDRVDERRRLAGLPPAAPKGLYITTLCLTFVPFVGFLSILILAPIAIGLCQSQVNGLVLATRGPQ